LGSADEISIANHIKLKINSKYLHSYVGKLSISEASYLLSKSYVLVTNDSGLMHIADLLSLRIYSIFSCRDMKNKWYPVNKKSKVYRYSSSCKCLPFKDFCPYKNYCINKTKPLEIIKELKIIN
jgi:ADP-heptose:LPS heptosyltransferase